MKPEKCPCALVYDGIKLCLWKVHIYPCEIVAEKDCFLSDEFMKQIENVLKDLKEQKN